jgi:hypothetical protein
MIMGSFGVYLVISARDHETARSDGVAEHGAGLVKLLTADLYEVPAWISPVFIAAVLAGVAILSIRDRRQGPAAPARRSPATPQCPTA